MPTLPFYIYLVFGAATLFTGWIFWYAANYSKKILMILVAWLLVQALIAATGFYTYTHGLPPRFVLAVAPALIAIALVFASARGRRFVDRLDNRALTLLHIVRIPVELVLFWLCAHMLVAPQMTFEGLNYDILSGITAPMAWYAMRHKRNRNLVLAWNLICLALLLNIVTIAVLAAPVDFQQISLDQPNVAVMYFPFIWLPAFIVPLVLFSHLASIRQLLRRKTAAPSKAHSVFTQ